MKKQVKAIILPTEDKTNIAIMRSGNRLVFIKEPLDLNNGFQHIYITSDDEIKEGDWFYNAMNKIVIKATNRYSETKNPIPHRKIIATSDDNIRHCKQCGGKQELNMDGVMQFTHINKCVSFSEPLLPNVQQSFLKAFVESGGKEDWEVEYVQLGITGTKIALSEPYLKLDSNNCVILSAVEESRQNKQAAEFYRNRTKEMMYSSIDLMGNQDGSFDHFLLNSLKFSQEDREVIMDAVHDWIKENNRYENRR